jgi:hypothetical protein
MKMLADNFSNPSSGNMAVFARTANATDPITSVEQVLGQGFTNVRSANGNLP